MSREFWSEFANFAYFPFGRGSRFFGPGEVRLALLSLLEDGPRHGYDLIKELEGRSRGMYRASAGVIYPTLQLLEDEGLLASEQHDGKRVYRLTDEGRAEVERQRQAIDRIWRRAESWANWAPLFGPEAGALAGPLASVAKAAVKAASRVDAGRVVEMLDRMRREMDDLR